MGRFSKLETHTPAPSPADAAPGGRVVRRRAGPEDSSVAAAPPPDYDVHYYLGQGDRCFYGGNYQKALRMYSRAVQEEHSAIEPWVGQIRCLLEMKQAREAMVWVRRALELFPEEPRLISLQGMAYAASGMVERGLQCSDYALARPGQSGADPLVWIVRGAILLQGESRNADPCFAKAMETRPRDDWRTPLSLGLVMIAQKKWTAAADFLDVAAQLQPKNDFLWERLGWARERLGLGARALEAYQTAIQLNPKNRAAEDGLLRLQRSSVWTRLARRLFR